MTFCSSNKILHLCKTIIFIFSQLSALQSLSTLRPCVFPTFLSNHPIYMRLMHLSSSQTDQSVLALCSPSNHRLGQLALIILGELLVCDIIMYRYFHYMFCFVKSNLSQNSGHVVTSHLLSYPDSGSGHLSAGL